VTPAGRRWWWRGLATAGRWLAWLVRFSLTVAAAGVLLAGGAVLVASRASFPAVVHLQSGPLALPGLDQRSTVYASDGSVLAVLHADEDRVEVPLGSVPAIAVNAVLDVEDADFFVHKGVNARSVLRALATNVQAGQVRQGGSTITQQLVKNSLLGSRQDFHRKLLEVATAARLEKQLTKAQILERYLNTVYFGNGAYGIQAASLRYFDVDVGRLTTPQAALLAGMIRSPEGYDPFRQAAAARQRRDVVLAQMVRHGHLAPVEADADRAVALPARPFDPPPVRDYFTEAVKLALLGDRRLGATPQERYHAVFGGGLSVHTTIDPVVQRLAADKVAAGLPDTKGEFTASLVSIDPASGAVRALVGGPNFDKARFNLALDGIGRQAGSSFKPFTLVAALENGFSPEDTLDGSSPCQIPNPGGTPNPYRPDNFEGGEQGVTSVTDATVHSVNCAYARLAMDVGLAKVADAAHRMGITAHLNVVPSMTLGTNEVTPLQMASGYATLAADGMYHRPYLVERVNGPDGREILAADHQGRRAVSSQVARVATQVLQQVVLRGTGTAASLGGRPVAGKTGTAENFHDAWFVGFTPQLATAVWMGDPAGEVPMRNVGGIQVVGGTYPARIWGAFMNAALAGRPVVGFPLPPEPVPPGRFLVDGTARARDPAGPGGAGGDPSAGGGPRVTLWCSASCGRGSTRGPAPPPTPPP